ncbi:acyltransferase family protein [Alteromonas pelagimontana]|uniref:Acyltransferase family protein n=2 Tax=Alteromonas pelagimontana TaxID=1858656 RepID=A0A6M4MJB7_9ALTE|nr:acyltransferase family protein [Alteromonas pelagimontana]
MKNSVNERRYDVDWLRTLAFGILILYHVGMYYVADWEWHIKSDETSEFLQNLMILTNPWRMSLLFFISAMALALVEHKYSGWRLISNRTLRLMIPLLFGMFVIVAPQVYIEARNQSAIAPGFLAFWAEYINPRTSLLAQHHTSIGLLTWNHLWFLPYLWVYSLLLSGMSVPLKKLAQSTALSNASPRLAFIVIVVALAGVWVALREHFPVTHALVDDGYNHGKYFLIFVAGYLFVLQGNWWQAVITNRRTFGVLAVAGYSWLLVDRQGLLNVGEQLDNLLIIKFIHGCLLSLNHWAWIFAVTGYAGYWLNRPSSVIRYANQAILPWYILHQTLIVLAAWWLKPFDIAPGVESVIIIALTCLGCLFGYALAKRVSVLRILVGLKRETRRPLRKSMLAKNL